ncbi:hypothetical protein [Kitasatospora phosalacinea]|uniref:Knr4/Smi1-like domain-containing protein n=1 Tax=Kitasatospora phosalacinea TaxID=2065 RepID=A0ABW6GRY0_9ACTN
MDLAGAWNERLAGLVEGRAARRREVDWAGVEARLGTGLPHGYRLLVERFGAGAFNGLSLLVPQAPDPLLDLERNAVHLSASAAERPGRLDPYPVFPAPGGLLQWADGEDGHLQAYWLTDAGDPDRWPVLSNSADGTPEEWERFDGPVGQYLFRLFTGRHPGAHAGRPPSVRFEPAGPTARSAVEPWEDEGFAEWSPDPHW